MKPNFNLFLGTVLVMAFSATATHAATKSATGTDLTDIAAWDAIPTSADIATWTTGSLGAGLTAATDVSWGGINISDAATNVGITGAGSVTLGSSGVTLTGNKTLTVANAIVLGTSQIWSIADVTATTASDATFSGIISGGFDLTKSGAGTLTLSGVNTYTGKTSVTGGILSIAADSGLGAAPVSAVADQLTLNAGTLAITGATTIHANRGITIGASGGTIDTSSQSTSQNCIIASALTGSNGITLKANGSLAANGGGVGGNLQLSGNNSGLTGGIAITGGLIYNSSANSLGSNALTLTNGGGLVNTARGGYTLSNAITVGTGGGTLRNYGTQGTGGTGVPVNITNVTGLLTGSGTLNITDAGGVTLDNVGNTFSGKYVATGTYLGASNDASFGAVPVAFTADSITLAGNATLGNMSGTAFGTHGGFTLNANRGITLGSGGGTLRVGYSDTMTVAGVVTGAGQLTKSDGATLVLSGANTYTGATTISGGTMKAGVASVAGVSGALGKNSAVSLANAASTNLDLNGFDTQIGSLTGGGTTGGNVILGAKTLTIGGDNTSPVAYAGVISGAGGAITKIGTGTQTLTGASTFTGNVTINANGGTVNVGGTVNSTSPTATSLGNMTTAGKTVTVNSGASLVFTSSDGWGAYNYKTPVKLIADGGTITRVSGTTTFNSIGDVELKNGGHLTTTNGGNNAAVGSFGLNGNVIVSGTSGSFIDTLAGQTAFTQIQLGNNLTVSTTTFDVAATGDATADLTVSAILADKTLGGAASIIKTGAGKMVVSGVSTYTGTTTVNGGILSLTSASATTLNSLSIANGATLSTNVASGTNQRNLTGNLTLTGGTLSANSNVSDVNKGQFFLSNAAQQVIVTGDNTSTIAAEMHMAGTHIFNVADGASAVDLLVSGQLSHHNLTLWGGIQKTGAGTMSITSLMNGGTYALGGFELGGGTLMFSGNLGISGNTPTNKAGYFLADFSANSTLKWNTGNTFDPTVLGNLRIRDAVTATFDTNGNTVAFGSAIINGTTGTGALTKAGAGTLTLSAVNTYTGATAVNGGTLLVNGSLAAGSAVSIGGSGTLGGSGTVNGSVAVASGGILTGSGSVNGAVSVASGGKIAAGTGATTLTLAGGLILGTAGADTSIFNITPRTAGLTPSLNITLNNGFVANGGAGTSTINVLGGAPALGTYTLIDYLGTLGGNGFGSFTLGTLPSRVLASLVDNAGGTSIDLNVTGVDSARWSGAVGSEWSTATIGGSKNWVLNSNGVTTTDYISGDTVMFDDTATTTAVDISVANVAPASVTFDHTSKNYALTGSGKITGATGLTKAGGGTLTISNIGSDYTGTTAINGGALVISGAGQLGGTSAALTLGGGKLDLGATSQTVGAVSITAPSASGNTIQNGTLAGTSYAASNASGIATVTANLGGGAATLAKSGAGTLSLTGINTFTGATSITAGTLEIGGAGQLNNGAYAGAISNAGTLLVNSTANQTLSGAISGAGALTKANTGTLTLSGASTFTGNATINEGTVVVSYQTGGAASSLGDMTNASRAVTVNSGATLKITAADVFGAHNVKPATPIILDGGILWRVGKESGGSYFNSLGDITLKNGAQIQTGTGNVSTVQALTFNGMVTVSGTSGSSIVATAGTSLNGIHLGTFGGSTTFDVGLTGSSIDLSVSVPLADQVLGGTAGLIKTGAGKMVLSAANSYTGATAINGGTLAVNGSLANTSTTVGNTGTLQGSGLTVGSVTVQSGGFLAPGNSIESLGLGNLTLENGSTYAYELQTNLYGTTPGVAGDLTYSSGTLSIASGTILTLTDLAASTALLNDSKLTLISSVGAWNGGLFTYLGTPLADDSTFTLGANQWLFNYNDTVEGLNYASDSTGSFVTMTVVPEPNAAMLVGGLGMLALLRRRRA